MAFDARAIQIMIASPGDVTQERLAIRSVIEDWNAAFAQHHKTVLLPVGWDTHAAPEMGNRPQAIINARLLRTCDLLIAVFWTRLGSPTGEAASGTVEEIEEHMAAGKPVMLYFSDQPVQLDSVDPAQWQALKAFRADCEAKGLVERFDSLTEFREKLTRQLPTVLQRDFLSGTTSPEQSLPARRSDRASLLAASLSPDARRLLIAAADDHHATIMYVRYMGGATLQVGSESLFKDGSAREEAHWRSVLDELLGAEAIESRGHKGEIFEVTDLGFQVADMLRADAAAASE